MTVTSLFSSRALLTPSLFALALLPLAIATAVSAQETGSERVRIAVAGTDHQLTAPPGTRVEKLVDLEMPRLISIGPDGEMFIGSKADRVYRLAPPYEEAELLVELGGYPHSVVQRGDQLYVATTEGLLRADYQAGASLASADFETVARLPGGASHSSRTVSLGPDGRLYVSIGVLGNCPDQYLGQGYAFEDRRGGVLVLDESGDEPQWQPYTSGLRNPIGLAWDPAGTLHVINNGPDHWGYEQPREVLVRAEEGSFHGMPWFQWVDGEHQRDPCISSEPPRPASDIPAPVVTLPARNAPMGLTFLPADNRLAFDAVAALHGSWATRPDGGPAGDPATRRDPMLVGITLDEHGTGEASEWLTGFQDDQGQRWARPVGIIVAPDGALYFTSDSGEEGLFRVTLEGEPVAAGTPLDATARPGDGE